MCAPLCLFTLFLNSVYNVYLCNHKVFSHTLFVSLNETQEKVEGLEKDTGSPRMAWSISKGVPKITESSKSPGLTVLL